MGYVKNFHERTKAVNSNVSMQALEEDFNGDDDDEVKNMNYELVFVNRKEGKHTQGLDVEHEVRGQLTYKVFD